LANYLEGGPGINYSTDLPATADTLWSILSSSESVYLDDTDYNDQVIAVYKSEIWERVKKLKDLNIDNAAAVPATSPIELLTKSLAECLARYGNLNSNRQLPYPAPLALTDYRSNSNYDDNNLIRYGRFPQVLNSSFVAQSDFVLDTSGTSYCESLIPGFVTDYDELFWKNWKDHFFYVVSQDFDSANTIPASVAKCGNCITVDSKTNKIAAMVFFAGEKKAIAQDRVWWWDDATTSVTIDDKANVGNYLEGVNQTIYAGGIQDYITAEDYSYCVEYDNTTFQLAAIKCSDL
jgi:hypothetical protein